MNIEIVERKTFEVCGFVFDTLKDAEDFISSNTLVYDDYDQCFVALKNKDIDRFKNLFMESKESFFEQYRTMCNSNSMGALYPLSVCNYVMQINNVSQDEIWGENK